MSSLIPVDVNGVTFQAHGEYTSGAVVKEFQNSLAAFVNIFNIGLPSDTRRTIGVDPDSPTLTDDIINELGFDYDVYLQAALEGGTVRKNFRVDADYPGPGQGPVEEDVQVVGLFDLLKNGLEVTDDPVMRPGRHFLSLEMAGAVEQLIRSLQMAGIDIQDDGNGNLVLGSPITNNDVRNWKNLSASSDAIRKIMQYAVDTSGNQNRTLQALVELIYVRTGNELLSDNMERLEDAIGVTKGSLDALNRLQTLHNKITAEEKAKFEDVFTGWGKTTDGGDRLDATAFVRGSTAAPQTDIFGNVSTPDGDTFSGVVEAAEKHFIGIDPTLLGQVTESDRVEFLSLRKTIIEEIEKLEGQTGQEEAGTLLEKMRTVLGDIHKAFSSLGILSTDIDGLSTIIAVNLNPLPLSVAVPLGTNSNLLQKMHALGITGIVSARPFAQGGGTQHTFNTGELVQAALAQWILDSSQVENTLLNIAGIDSGKIQRNLSAAVSAGQSLNDTQKEEVRRYLFVFEEYYKSAAAVLSKVTQILERMAQAIAR